MDNVKRIHPTPKLKRRLEDCKNLEWFTHPEIVDWDTYLKEENERWLALPNELKQLEEFEQIMAERDLTKKEIAEYERLEKIAYDLG